MRSRRCAEPSTPPGETSVLAKALAHLAARGLKAAAVKLDCVATEDDVRYASLGIASRKGLSGGLCPDHFFAANLDEVLAWGAAEHAAVLATESAGRCNRCSPHLAGVLGVCVVDCVGGLDTPRKIGPMLKLADIVVLTTGDLVSQAEREVFAFNVRST